MFNNLDMLDPKVAEVVQVHISEIEEKHKLHYDSLQKKYDELIVKLKYYTDMDGVENPGYGSILLKRGVECLKGDRHMI